MWNERIYSCGMSAYITFVHNRGKFCTSKRHDLLEELLCNIYADSRIKVTFA